MSDTVRAAIAELHATEFTIAPVTLRDPGARDVVVEIAASAFCYSDWLAIKGDTGLPALGIHPVVLGHSAVGTVVDGGADARYRPGARVVISATPECGACFWCLEGRKDQCEQLFVPAPVLGALDDGRSVRMPGASGTYAQRTVIRDMQVWPVEIDLPDSWLAMMGCGIVSGMGAVANVSPPTPGSSVVVVGCGQEGLWMIQAARILGAGRIIAVEPIAERRALAARVGATHVVDPGDGNALEAVRSLTEGRGADFGFDAGASIASVQDAFAFTRLGGVVTLTAYVTRDSRVDFPLFDLALRGRDVRSSQSGRIDMRRDMARFLPWLRDGLVDVDAMLGGIHSLEHINTALAAARDRTEVTPIVVP
jgi:Zn-dependent alcohol dehydrogenase